MYWRPNAVIWFERVDSPLLLEAAAQRGLPLFLQDAVAPDLQSPRARALERRLLGFFERIFAADAKQAESIRALGSMPVRIETTGRLRAIPQPPPCIESERETLAEAFNGRPAWLAACPDPREIPVVLAAHREARRSAHRLLLILVPRADEEGPELAERLAAEGWSTVRRGLDEDPQEHTDIFIGDSIEEIGMFYRLAPVTFLGGTLSDRQVPRAIDPATLGSAIIAGPFSGSQEETLRRLRRAGGCRLVVDPARLGSCLVELLAPDRAAELALAAWDVASDGSLVVDRLASAVISALRNTPA